jgi:hypothetical protein
MAIHRPWPQRTEDDGNGGRGGGRPGQRPGPGADPYAGTREEMDRAIRRLDALEWVVLLFAVGFALGGGALVAWILSAGTDLSFRVLWIGLSLFLLIVPGAFVFFRERFR